MLELRRVWAGYGAGAAVLRGVDLALGAGEMAALIGPNGGGKTTLLRVAGRVLRAREGAVLLQGRDIWPMPQAQVARMVGYVPQWSGTGLEFTVQEAVLMGRYPHLSGWGRPGAADHAVADQAMRSTGVYGLRDRYLGELSGGEAQRVLIARCLAQGPQVMLLDEPTSHLDLAYQAEVLGLLGRLNAEAGLAVLAVMHDLNLAAQFFRRFVLLGGGEVMAGGGPDEVLTPAHLSRAYGAPVEVVRRGDGRVMRVHAGRL